MQTPIPRNLGLYLLLSALTIGCAHYEPMPLTSAAVEQALTLPLPSTLRDRATKLDNPLLPPAMIDSPDGLSPDAAAVLAVLVNPSIRANRDRMRVAAGQLIQAGILPNPQLDLTFDPVTGGNTAGTSAGYLIGLSYDVMALVSHDAKVAAARAQSASVRLDVAWQEWQIAQAARKAVYDLLSLRAQIDIAREVDRGLSEDAALVRRAVDAHQKTLLELSAAESASRKARADLLALQRDERHQALALNQALGILADQPVPLQGLALPASLSLPPRQQLLDGLEERRLDLLALKRGYGSQEQVVHAAVLSQFPRLVLNIHKASDTTNVHTTGPGITMDLPIFDRNQGNIAIERANRQRLFDEYIARVFEARSTIALTLADIESITLQIADAQAAIPGLQRLVRAYQTALGQGNVDILSYYTARSDLASKQLDVVKLKQQLLQSKVALEIAAGIYLPDARPTTGPTTRPSTMPNTLPATREVHP